MTCQACDHELIIGGLFFDNDEYWMDAYEDIGHICNDHNCPHTCVIDVNSEQYAEPEVEE
jgi:hypothetical protein